MDSSTNVRSVQTRKILPIQGSMLFFSDHNNNVMDRRRKAGPQKIQMALNIPFVGALSLKQNSFHPSQLYIHVCQGSMPLCIFSYTCRTSRSYWTAVPPCVVGPHSRELAVARGFGERSTVGLRLLGCDVCTGPRSVNICFRHSRCMCRSPCSNWHDSLWACVSISIPNPSENQCTNFEHSMPLSALCRCPLSPWSVSCVT